MTKAENEPFKKIIFGRKKSPPFVVFHSHTEDEDHLSHSFGELNCDLLSYPEPSGKSQDCHQPGA